MFTKEKVRLLTFYNKTNQILLINSPSPLVHTRRDDLESLGYLFVDLLKGSLPWAGIVARTSRQGWTKMKEMKEEVSLEELCENIPRGFMTYLDYTRNLRFEEEPNYKFLKQLLVYV